MSTPTPSTAPLRLTTSLAKRAAMDLFLLAFFIVVLLSVVAFAMSYQQLESRTFTQLTQAAATSEDVIMRSFAEARERGRFIARDPLIIETLHGTVEGINLDRWLLDLSQENDGIKGIAIYDHNLSERGQAGVTIDAPLSLSKQPAVTAVISPKGWEWYDVSVPLTGSGGTTDGMVILRESAETLLRPLRAGLPTIGATAVLDIAYEGDGNLKLVRLGQDALSGETDLGPFTESIRQNLPVAAGVVGEEGTSLSEDERGQTVLAAVRSLPELGWGVSVQVERHDVFADVLRLTAILGAVGGLLLVLGVLLSSLLSRGLTKHLRELIEKISRLTPGQWQLERSIHTGDEIELLDHVLVDVTTRLRGIYSHLEAEVERRTRETLELFALDRAIVESINYGVLTVNNDGLITACNPSAARLLGKTQEALIGQPATDVFPLVSDGHAIPADSHPLREALTRRELVKSRVSQRLCLARPQGEPLPIAMTAAPLLVENQLQGAVAVFEDVTEERQIDAMKSEFISLAGHQLRTPIGALRWHIELLEEDAAGFTPDQRHSLEEMKTLVERTVHLLNTLLQSAKLDEGGIEPSWTKLNLPSLLRELTASLSELSAQYKVEQTMDVPETLALTTDQTLLSIVLYNLLSNAIKYSRHDQASLFLSAHDLGQEIEIKIRDNGIGIPEEDRSRLFEKFFRAKNAKVIDTDGNGLGLYISQSILTRLQGRISFTSAEGKGTTFTVVLPKQPEVHLKQ